VTRNSLRVSASATAVATLRRATARAGTLETCTVKGRSRDFADPAAPAGTWAVSGDATAAASCRPYADHVVSEWRFDTTRTLIRVCCCQPTCQSRNWNESCVFARATGCSGPAFKEDAFDRRKRGFYDDKRRKMSVPGMPTT
jgi:hypothetical protein